VKKGHAPFLEVAARVAERHPEALFLFLGEGSERDALEARCDSSG